MADGKAIKTRPVGATAVMGRTGFPAITSQTNGTLQVVTGLSEPGFNPLDLLYASLSACIAMSARIAAGKLGVLDRFEGVTVKVSGEKAADGPSRIGRFDIQFDIRGDFDEETRKAIAEAAESEICTVGNTIRSHPDFVTTHVE